MSNMPPKAKIDTWTPVLPKGRVGTTPEGVVFWADLTAACACLPTGASMAPMPVTPIVFKKALREQLFGLSVMVIIPYGSGRRGGLLKKRS
jgi:hypothetical protein